MLIRPLPPMLCNRRCASTISVMDTQRPRSPPTPQQSAAELGQCRQQQGNSPLLPRTCRELTGDRQLLRNVPFSREPERYQWKSGKVQPCSSFSGQKDTGVKKATDPVLGSKCASKGIKKKKTNSTNNLNCHKNKTAAKAGTPRPKPR